MIDDYMLNYMLVPGRVENWTVIIDMGDLAFKDFDLKFNRMLFHVLGLVYRCRGRKGFCLNAGKSVMLFWNIAKVFIPASTK